MLLTSVSSSDTQKTAESPAALDSLGKEKPLFNPPPPFQLHWNYQLDLQKSGSAKSAVDKHGKIWNTDGFKYHITRALYRGERMERPEINKKRCAESHTALAHEHAWNIQKMELLLVCDVPT